MRDGRHKAPMARSSSGQEAWFSPREEEFNSPTGHHIMPFKCKDDLRSYQRERQKRLRLEWLGVNGPCKLCKSSYNLQVDHVDPTAKISHRIWSWSESRREAELVKCQILCEECHKAKTAQDKRAHFTHGTRPMYKNGGCRCKPCRAANAAYQLNRKRRAL